MYNNAPQAAYGAARRRYQQKPLDFNVGEFREGLNSTCRNGPDWSHRVKGGSVVPITIEHKSTGKVAYIQEVRTINFASTPISFMAVEHDEDCRTYDGLLSTMREIYPGFEPMSPVTWLLFTVVDDDEDAEASTTVDEGGPDGDTD